MAYRGLSLQVFDTQALSYQHLPDIHQSLIPSIPIRLSHAAEAAEHNADLLERISALTGIQSNFVPEDTDAIDLELTVLDFPDVVDTLLAIVRDWSAFGATDRARLYDCVISAVQEAADDALSTISTTARLTLAYTSSSDRIPTLTPTQQDEDEIQKDLQKLVINNNENQQQQNSYLSPNVQYKPDSPTLAHQHIASESKAASGDSLAIEENSGSPVLPVAPFCVLVVGASLGRLSWELARMGYSVQGVEKSYLQLFTSNFILNGIATPENPLHLYPFVHHTAMVSTADEQLQEVQFPDVDPKQLDNQADFSMVAGDFIQLYKEESVWDCVVTCFSLENAQNVITYIRRIASILKPGGTWVNHGSLDFRYDDDSSSSDGGAGQNIEITKEELDFVIARSGLRVLRRESFHCKPPYFVNGMVHEEYETIFFVAVKV